MTYTPSCLSNSLSFSKEYIVWMLFLPMHLHDMPVAVKQRSVVNYVMYIRIVADILFLD